MAESDEEVVRRKYPNLRWIGTWRGTQRHYELITINPWHCIGRGETRPLAWADARRRLEKVEPEKPPVDPNLYCKHKENQK